MKIPPSYNRIAGLIGNLLEHYDNALFGLLAPFIAPLFFKNQDPITALILTYALFPLGLLTKPLGSLYFGRLGDRFGRKQALFQSLLGMALVTTGIGILPDYDKIGAYAPLLLGIGRMLQSFFAAGESAGGAVFLLEHTSEAKKGLISSFYDISSVGGILLASAGVAVLSAGGGIESSWRVLFILGGLTAVLGVFIRRAGHESPEFSQPEKKYSPPLLPTLRKHGLPLLFIALGAGFSHVTYSLSFTFMNGFAPLVTGTSKAVMLSLNTKLLFLDMLLLPFFGYFAYKFGKEKIMLFGSAGLALIAIPLFGLLEGADLHTITFVRIAIMLFGIAFAAPFYAWAIDLAPKENKYLIFAFGSALGSQIIGAPSSAICLWLYKITGVIYTPGFYLALSGLTVSSVLIFLRSRKNEKLPASHPL